MLLKGGPKGVEGPNGGGQKCVSFSHKVTPGSPNAQLGSRRPPEREKKESEHGAGGRKTRSKIVGRSGQGRSAAEGGPGEEEVQGEGEVQGRGVFFFSFFLSRCRNSSNKKAIKLVG